MKEIVIDASTLAHCSDPRQPHQEQAVRLIHWLLEGTTSLAVDSDFNMEEEARNRSIIGSEYLARLARGDLGYAVVAELASKGRVQTYHKRTTQSAQQVITQHVPDSGDRVYAAVAHQCDSRVLVSEDQTDFSSRAREALARRIDLRVIFCTELCSELGL